MSRKHPRYGYRRITALLRREGFEVNPKRVARTRRPESTPGGTTLIFGRPTASLRSGLHQPTKPSTTSTNQPQRNFSFDVSHLRGQATTNPRAIALSEVNGEMKAANTMSPASTINALTSAARLMFSTRDFSSNPRSSTLLVVYLRLSSVVLASNRKPHLK